MKAATGVAALQILAACFFILGFFDRTAAIVMAIVLAWTTPSLWFVAWLLLAHALLPPAPFGSLAARKRVDPRGGWFMPQWIFIASWIVLIAAYGWMIYTRTFHPQILLLHFFTFDPAWIPRLASEKHDRVLYDGACGLCHRSVRFAVAEDRFGDTFTFAPLARVDTVVVETADGRTLTRSAAVIRIAKRLGGLWRILGTLLQLVPRPVRDGVYGFVARVRYRIFGTRSEACPILPPDLRARFEPHV